MIILLRVVCTFRITSLELPYRKCGIVVTCITWPVYYTVIGRSIWWRSYTVLSLAIVFGDVMRTVQTGTSDKCLICSFKTWDSQVSAYSPFHFSFTVPLSYRFELDLDMPFFAWCSHKIVSLVPFTEPVSELSFYHVFLFTKFNSPNKCRDGHVRLFSFRSIIVRERPILFGLFFNHSKK